MPTCEINGKKVDFNEGENLVDVAKKGGIDIPIFCYHPGLSVVAQCRQCVVEVEGVPKLLTACSTTATDGMKVNTQSEKVREQQAAVMEFLLVNHPLDCPICDKSGECDLQDTSYQYGSSYQRSLEERRTYLDVDMGPVIQKNMNRCIHCTRCIRFGDEIAGIREMVALQRGNNVEITTINGLPLETEYAGNYADICPTGSLTLKDFRFRKRAWMLKKTPSVCEGCSRGCNMEIQWDNRTIYRCVPRENLKINRYWLCDEGRFNYNYLHDQNRIVDPLASGKEVDWAQAIEEAQKVVSSAKKLAILIGSDLTQEEASALLEFSKLNGKQIEVFHFGTPGVLSAKDDEDSDKILKRKSKTSNLHGLEKLGIRGVDAVPAGIDSVLVFRGGRAVLPDLSKVKAIGVGVYLTDESAGLSAVLPGAGFAEKEGTIVNWAGTEQKLKRAVVPPGQSKLLSEILAMLIHSDRSEGVA